MPSWVHVWSYFHVQHVIAERRLLSLCVQAVVIRSCSGSLSSLSKAFESNPPPLPPTSLRLCLYSEPPPLCSQFERHCSPNNCFSLRVVTKCSALLGFVRIKREEILDADGFAVMIECERDQSQEDSHTTNEGTATAHLRMTPSSYQPEDCHIVCPLLFRHMPMKRGIRQPSSAYGGFKALTNALGKTSYSNSIKEANK